MKKQKTLYDILEVSNTASIEVIKVAYLFLVKKYHPDNNPAFREEANIMTKELNYAYSVLSDPVKRAQYDSALNANPFSAQPNTDGSTNRHENSTSAKRHFEYEKLKNIFISASIGLILISGAIKLSSMMLQPSTEETAVINTTAESIPLVEAQIPSHGRFLKGASQITYGDAYIDEYSSGRIYAPFLIRPPVTGGYYYMKLTIVGEATPSYIIFLHGNGEEIEVNLRCGEYLLSYACGSTWYGENDLFGPETQCYRSDAVFSFYHEGDQVCGQEVTLYKVKNGNLNTEEIPIDEF